MRAVAILILAAGTAAFSPATPPLAPRPWCHRAPQAVFACSAADGGGGGDDEAARAAEPIGGGVAAWVQTNVLQGVSAGPETYAVMAVYFVQGVLGLASLARTYFMKDQLGLSPAEVSALQGITILPWVVKPLYGFCSDGLPLFGYRRKSYLIGAGALGCASWLALATVVSTPAQAVAAATCASLGVAVSDVVVDSLVVQRARDDPSASSGALQSLCWGCQSFGGLTSAYFSGSLLTTMSPQVRAAACARAIAIASIVPRCRVRAAGHVPPSTLPAFSARRESSR